MKGFTRLLACSLAAWLLLTAVLCEPFYNAFWDWAPSWTVAHLNNAGANPEIPNTGEAPRTAYGIRLANEAWVDWDGRAEKDKPVAAKYSSTYLRSIRVLAQTPFGDLPAGSDLSAFFRARFEPGVVQQASTFYEDQITAYVPLDEALAILNQPSYTLLKSYHTDLLLLNAPPAGEYQFAVELQFGWPFADSLLMPDTVLLTTPIRLQ